MKNLTEICKDKIIFVTYFLGYHNFPNFAFDNTWKIEIWTTDALYI